MWKMSLYWTVRGAEQQHMLNKIFPPYTGVFKTVFVCFLDFDSDIQSSRLWLCGFVYV